MTTLQQMTDAWGTWLAQKNGTSCMFTSSTSYSDHFELGNYTENQCNVQQYAYSYLYGFVPTGQALIAYQTDYDNATGVTQTENFQYTATSAQSFNWSITEDLEVGVSASGEIGLPFVAEGTVTVTAKFDLSSTQGDTYTNTQSWTVSTPINVPAESSVQCTMLINTQSYNIPFSVAVVMHGYVAIWFNDQVNLDGSGFHWLWFIPITSMFSDVINNSLVDATAYFADDMGGLYTEVQGQLTGSQGINTQVTTNEGPADAIARVDKLTERVLYPGIIAGN